MKARKMKTQTFIIRASNIGACNDNDIYGETTNEAQAQELLFNAKMSFNYADVVINGSRYCNIN